MKAPSLFRSILLALGLTLLGHFGITLLPLLLPFDLSLKLLISVLVAIYLWHFWHVHRRDPKRPVGLLSIATFWLAASALGWLLTLSHAVWAYALGQLALVWLIRSALCYRNLFSPLLDLALCGLSVLLMLYTWHSTHSSFASLWVLFLTQSLSVLIPRERLYRLHHTAQSCSEISPFASALNAAENALKLLR
jgi:hypothetical protein